MYTQPLMYCRECSIAEFGVDNYDFCSKKFTDVNRSVVCKGCGPILVDRFGSRVSKDMTVQENPQLKALPAPKKWYIDACAPVPKGDAGPWITDPNQLIVLPDATYEIILCVRTSGVNPAWCIKVGRGNLALPRHSTVTPVAALRTRLFNFSMAPRRSDMIRWAEKVEYIFADRVNNLSSHIVAVRALKGNTYETVRNRVPYRPTHRPHTE